MSNRLDNFRVWYSKRQPLYKAISVVAARTISDLIKAESIDTLSISSRAKDPDSALAKITRKGYAAPEEQMTDLAGVRVIAYVETDLPRIVQIVEDSFHVIAEKSSNRADELGVDRAGYRSIHYVCDLGEDRLRLPEFSQFRGILFEIQIRTVLQHAWAEVEHDRRYKFSGVLPTPLQRRLFLLAGMLELADRELSAISADVDAYANEVARATSVGELNVEINSTSVRSYLRKRLEHLQSVPSVEGDASEVPAAVLSELRAYGIRTLEELHQIIDDVFLDILVRLGTVTTYIGVLRDAMMYADLEKYFDVAWQNHWQGVHSKDLAPVVDKYGMKRVKHVIDTHGLDFFPADDF